MSKQTVAVQIAGRDYKIRTDTGEESLRRIAGYVDRAMNRVRVSTATVDTQDVAMLTCLNLARQLLALHDERASAGEDAGAAVHEGRLRDLIERVEEVGAAQSARLAQQKAEKAEEPSSQAASQAEAPSEREPARTLELPSPEALRERSEEAARESEASEQAEPEAMRAAAGGGGRDRAS